MSGLRVTAPDVAACRAQADVETAAAFLARVGLRRRNRLGEVLARLGAGEELLDDVHVRIVTGARPMPL
jgi:hypothetical protein